MYMLGQRNKKRRNIMGGCRKASKARQTSYQARKTRRKKYDVKNICKTKNSSHRWRCTWCYSVTALLLSCENPLTGFCVQLYYKHTCTIVHFQYLVLFGLLSAATGKVILRHVAIGLAHPFNHLDMSSALASVRNLGCAGWLSE